MTLISSRVGLLAMVAAVSGCGLISSDVTDFDIALNKDFAIDTGTYQVDQASATALLSTSCTSMPTACMTGASNVCPMDCTGTCAASGTCELDLDVSLYQMVDLLNDQSQLKAFNDRPIIKVTIDTVTFSVAMNTLNVATPAMDVYVAPMSIMDPKDSMAKKIGTIPAVAAGATPTDSEVQFTATGKQDLIATMGMFKTPFNVLVGTTLVVTNGTPVPMGKLDGTVRIIGHAGL
ncbi:MAG TPA: hypothetical protein VGM90_16485 [Kofleriaceae bacterium]|jgi:hypothetical protein